MSRLEQDFLLRALLYSTPQETWTDQLEGKLTDELFQKVFGSYKPPVEIGISELTMQYVVETKQYGKQKIQLSCPLNEFCLSGNKFAMFGKINYEILGPAEKNGKMFLNCTEAVCSAKLHGQIVKRLQKPAMSWLRLN